MSLKERKLMMTPTLWNSIDWLHKCPPSWRDRAYKSLSDTLNREWNSNAAVERGMAFENALINAPYEGGKIGKWFITENLDADFRKYYELIHKSGNSFQEKARAEIVVGDRIFFFYGRIDVWIPEPEDMPIIDIKTTAKYKGESQYLSGWQHKVYCFCKKRKDFKFLSYEFDDSGVDAGQGPLVAIHDIEWSCESFDALEKEIQQKTNEVVDFLRSDSKLKQAYMRIFNRY